MVKGDRSPDLLTPRTPLSPYFGWHKDSLLAPASAMPTQSIRVVSRASLQLNLTST